MVKARHFDGYGAKERRRMIIQGSGIKQDEPRQECTSFRVKSTRNKDLSNEPEDMRDGTSEQIAKERIVAIVTDTTSMVLDGTGVVPDGTDLVPDGTTQ